MREEANGILYLFGLSDDDRRKYNTVSNKSEAQTKKFNMRRQEEGEPADSFITPLALLASRTLQLLYTMK